MPNIKSAKKKMKQDVRREKENRAYKKAVSESIKTIAKKAKEVKQEDIKKAHSLIDKAAKKNVIHKNKAARLKSKVSRLGTQK